MKLRFVKNYRKWLIGTCIVLIMPYGSMAQDRSARWDLQSCIEYARSRNIQIRQSRVALDQSAENTKQAKADRFPSLAFSSAHNYVNRPRPEAGDRHAYSGSYNLNAAVSLYQGGQLKKNIQQMELQNQVQELSIQEAENNIELAITQAYIQILYAYEAVKINQNTVEVSLAQHDRGKKLVQAGTLSQTDLAQLEAQYTSDRYQLVVSQTTLDNARLELKQLLELGIDEEMELVIPEWKEEEVLTVLPSKESVYLTSLKIMPEIRYQELNIQIAGIKKEKAWSGYLPQLNLSAGLGTSHASGSGNSGVQVRHNWSENVGLTLSVPIYSKRTNRTAVNLAQLEIENAELTYENQQKNLLKTVENVYQDAVSAQERYRFAAENLKAIGLSYRLVEKQFNLGMKNTFEMLTEKNNLLTAQQEWVQAKYMAILNQQLLNFYQGKEIRL